MCKKEYINLQTGEVLDWDRVEGLKDNAMLKVRPDLWDEWDFEKNDESRLDIWEMTKSSGKEVWWLGECGHEWYVSVKSRGQGGSCPYCANRKVLKGFNDISTTKPELAKLLANPEDGCRYAQNSNKKVDWKCPKCGEVIKDKYVYQINKNGLSCPNCSDGKSYPEKFMYNLLKELNIEFKKEKVFVWSSGKRYDFYIPACNAIIEVHGRQHYLGGFETVGGRTLEEERVNDQYKYELAMNNGIEHYIVIDARKSDFEWVTLNIKNSRLSMLFDLCNVNWQVIEYNSQKSIYTQIITLWKKGEYNITDIENKLQIHRTTVASHLKRGNILGDCKYDTSIIRKNKGLARARKIVRIGGDKCCEVYDTITNAGIINNYKCVSNISRCCSGKQESAYGYRWMYKEDYDKYIEEQDNKSA